MTSVSGNIPSLIVGVSQQPDSQRLPGSATFLNNAVPSITTGLRKRAPLQHRSNLISASNSLSDPDRVFSFIFERPDTSSKIVLIDADGVVRVFDEGGDAEAVIGQTQSSRDYLKTVEGSVDNILPVAVGDSLFLGNRDVTVLSSPIAETRRNPLTTRTFVINQALHDEEYSIHLNDVTYTHKTSADTSVAVTVQGIASALEQLLVDGGIITRRYGHILCAIDRPVGESYDVLSTTNNITAFLDELPSFDQLPSAYIPDSILKISPGFEDANSASDNSGYWVKWDASKRLWVETVGYNSQELLQRQTMPHVLRDAGNGTWTLSQGDYASRLVGDATSNATPSFVGFKIRDMFLNDNRLTVLADENVILSEVGEFFNFYRTTNTVLLDSDRLDFAALNSDNEISFLNWGVDFSGSLFLFSDEAQYELSYSQGEGRVFSRTLTPRTFYPNASEVRPVKFRNNILFVEQADSSEYAHIHEYQTDRVTGVLRTDVVTQHVPEFIPAPVYKIIPATTLGLTFILSRMDRSKVWVYSDYYNNGQRVQQAWSTWSFEFDDFQIIDADIDGDILKLIYICNGRILYGVVNLRERISGDFGQIEVLLDGKTNPIAVGYLEGVSYLSLDYSVSEGDEYIGVTTVDTDDFGPAGTQIKMTATSGNALEVHDATITAMQLPNILIGVPYRFEYNITSPYLRDREGSVIQDGRLQLRYMSVLYQRTSYFEAEVKQPQRDVRVSTFSGRVLGDDTNLFGAVPQVDGEFRFPISAENTSTSITFTNDTPWQCQFSSVEWEGSWRPRTRRIT